MAKKLGVEEDRVKRWFTHRRQAWKKGNKSQSHKSLKKKKQIDPKAAFNPNSFQHKLLKRSLITGKQFTMIYLSNTTDELLRFKYKYTLAY